MFGKGVWLHARFHPTLGTVQGNVSLTYRSVNWNDVYAYHIDEHEVKMKRDPSHKCVWSIGAFYVYLIPVKVRQCPQRAKKK